MTIVLDLPPDLESKLTGEATMRGVSLQDYVLQILGSKTINPSRAKNGAELVAYWQQEGLIGSRSDIDDSAGHARDIRRQAEAPIRLHMA